MKTLGLGVLSLGLAGAMAAVPALADNHETVMIGTSMFGEYEVGTEGAGEGASGDFSGEIDMAAGTLCYMLEVEGLDDFAAAHIHKAPAGENGPPVVTLELMGDDGDDVCVEVDAAVLKDIAANKAGYYVNVHTAAFPAGAVRGQLAE